MSITFNASSQPTGNLTGRPTFCMLELGAYYYEGNFEFRFNVPRKTSHISDLANQLGKHRE